MQARETGLKKEPQRTASDRQRRRLLTKAGVAGLRMGKPALGRPPCAPGVDFGSKKRRGGRLFERPV